MRVIETREGTTLYAAECSMFTPDLPHNLLAMPALLSSISIFQGLASVTFATLGYLRERSPAIDQPGRVSLVALKITGSDISNSFEKLVYNEPHSAEHNPLIRI